MKHFSFLSSAARKLIGDQIMPLGPGQPNSAVRTSLAAMTPVALFDAPVCDSEAASACLSGLWLLHDFLDESHSLSQDLATAEGSWWHGVMHRREPDYWNSKYWFRRVGKHPAMNAIEPGWDPFAFVDRVERAERGGADAEACRTLQMREWAALFDYCGRRAVGEERS